MSNAAKKLEAAKVQTTEPDGSKPIAMKYWYVAGHLGSRTDRGVTLGGYVDDGCSTQGKVRSITYYPAGGIAVVGVEVGWRPGILDAEQASEIQYLVLQGGHGRAL